jgi:hypothetical protein
MSILNNKNCGADGGNTGFGDCFIDLKNIVGGILVPSSRAYSASETETAATLLAAIQADILAAASADRVYPLASFEGLTDNTEDPTIQTLGYGGLAVTREGLYNLTFQFVQGGLCLSKSLRKFNSSTRSVLLFDSTGLLIGWKSGTDLKGIPLDMFYQRPFRLNDGTNVTNYATQLVFKPQYLNDLIGFVEMSIGDLSALKGLQDIVLSEAAGSNLPVLKIKAKTGCAGTDLYDLFSTELASSSLWTAKNEDGETIAITSVAVDAGLKAWTVTVDSGDPNYPVSGPVIISLAAPAVLAAAGIEGYEGLTLSVS